MKRLWMWAFGVPVLVVSMVAMSFSGGNAVVVTEAGHEIAVRH